MLTPHKATLSQKTVLGGSKDLKTDGNILPDKGDTGDNIGAQTKIIDVLELTSPAVKRRQTIPSRRKNGNSCSISASVKETYQGSSCCGLINNASVEFLKITNLRYNFVSF